MTITFWIFTLFVGVDSLLQCLLKVAAVASLLYGLAPAEMLLHNGQYTSAILQALVSAFISTLLFGAHKVVKP